MVNFFGPWLPWHGPGDLPDEFLAENRDLQRPRSREELARAGNLWRPWL